MWLVISVPMDKHQLHNLILVRLHHSWFCRGIKSSIQSKNPWRSQEKPKFSRHSWSSYWPKF